MPTDGHLILPYTGQGTIPPAAIVDLWTSEAGLGTDEAQRRLDEVLLVAVDADGRLAAVCTAYLALHRQVRLDLWHLRVFVARRARRGDLARALLNAALDHLDGRGEGAGTVVEVENPDVRRTRAEAVWTTTGLTFVGEDERGGHVRVRYFADRVGHLPALPPDWTTESLWGRRDEAWSERLVRFWLAHGALEEAEARRRLDQVVCVVLDARGELAGVSSVLAAEVPMIGRRWFWMYRNFLVPEAAQARPGLLAATFAALDDAYDPARDDPIGLCLLLGAEEAALRPEAQWEDPPMLYAGYAADGRQVRLGYFRGARVARS